MEDLFLHADSALEDFALDYTLAEDTNAKYQREKERLYHEETSADARMENITHDMKEFANLYSSCCGILRHFVSTVQSGQSTIAEMAVVSADLRSGYNEYVQAWGSLMAELGDVMGKVAAADHEGQVLQATLADVTHQTEIAERQLAHAQSVSANTTRELFQAVALAKFIATKTATGQTYLNDLATAREAQAAEGRLRGEAARLDEEARVLQGAGGDGGVARHRRTLLELKVRYNRALNERR